MCDANLICNEQFRHISFDQQSQQIGVSTSHGFFILSIGLGHNLSKYMTLVHETKFPIGGLNYISVLSDSNIIVFSGDNTEGGYSSKSVYLWDLQKNSVIKSIEFPYEVNGILFRTDVLIVSYGYHISFFNSCNFKEYYKTINPTRSMGMISFIQTISLNLVCLPSSNSFLPPKSESVNSDPVEIDSLEICDYHDPYWILGQISPLPSSRISHAEFSRDGEMIAFANDDGRTIYLYTIIPQIQYIATFSRVSILKSRVTGLSFDSLSNFILLSLDNRSFIVFSIPQFQSSNESQFPINVKEKIIFEFPKGSDFRCQFDENGYLITAIIKPTSKEPGKVNHIRLDLMKNSLELIKQESIELSPS